MPTEIIGVRDLKNQATRIVRAVREEQAEYIITVHGTPTAVIRPFTPEDHERLHAAQVASHLADLRELARQVGDAWTEERSAIEMVEDQRRDA